jgi:phosphoglycolate phosphatase-like HAD superfamily hydrolase
VGVLCGFGDKNELEQTGADLILENTSNLVGIFYVVIELFIRLSRF